MAVWRVGLTILGDFRTGKTSGISPTMLEFPYYEKTVARHRLPGPDGLRVPARRRQPIQFHAANRPRRVLPRRRPAEEHHRQYRLARLPRLRPRYPRPL